MMTCRDVRQNIIQTTGFLGALSTLCGMCLLLKVQRPFKTYYITINPSFWYQINIDNFPTTSEVFITIKQLRMFPHKVSAWYAIATILTHKHRIWLNNRSPVKYLKNQEDRNSTHILNKGCIVIHWCTGLNSDCVYAANDIVYII